MSVLSMLFLGLHLMWFSLIVFNMVYYRSCFILPDDYTERWLSNDLDVLQALKDEMEQKCIGARTFARRQVLIISGSVVTLMLQWIFV